MSRPGPAVTPAPRDVSTVMAGISSSMVVRTPTPRGRLWLRAISGHGLMGLKVADKGGLIYYRPLEDRVARRNIQRGYDLEGDVVMGEFDVLWPSKYRAVPIGGGDGGD